MLRRQALCCSGERVAWSHAAPTVVLGGDRLALAQRSSAGTGSHSAASLFAVRYDSARAALNCAISVYARCGRLPEPGELLLCESSTAREDAELLLMRRFEADTVPRMAGRSFYAARCDALPYATQIEHAPRQHDIERLRMFYVGFCKSGCRRSARGFGRSRVL